MAEKKNNLEEVIKAAIDNVENDRQELDTFIAALVSESNARPATEANEFGAQKMVLKKHDIATLMAKQYEVKAKMNDQLIKLASIIQKRDAVTSNDDDDFINNFKSDSFYDKIEEEVVFGSGKDED